MIQNLAYVSLVLVGIVVLWLLWTVLASIPEIARYYRLKNM